MKKKDLVARETPIQTPVLQVIHSFQFMIQLFF
jgi:hypothetical protein